MEPPAESPFKKDEPVSGARFWILLAAICAAVWLGFTLWYWGPRIEDEMDFLILAVAILLEGLLVVILCRSVRAASLCRQERNFEIMAAAVRTQRLVWMILAIFAAAGSVSFIVFALQHRPFNDHLRTSIREHPAPPSAAGNNHSPPPS